MLKKNGKHPVVLFPKSDQSDHFNRLMMKKAEIDVHHFEAIDTEQVTSAKTTRKRKAAKKTTAAKGKRKTAETGGLEETLSVGVGCAVMLRRNLDVQTGLVNGWVKVNEYSVTYCSFMNILRNKGLFIIIIMLITKLFKS